MAKLEAAGYISVGKKFSLRKPSTLYRMTEAGCRALAGYIRARRTLLGSALK